MGGLRTQLAQDGITFNLQEISEGLGNVTGGIRTGAAYDGLTTISVNVDTDKAFHWPGGTLFASALQIHGRNLSAENLDVLQTISGIEAEDTTRLWELWYQQAFDGGKADIKIGQQSLDQEFIVSQYGSLYLNAAMGWPELPAADLYAGGPVYPLSSLGVRLRAHVSPALTLLAGVFDDNPPGGPFNDDSQLRDAEASGTRFSLNTGALWIAELQYAANASPAKDCDSIICGLPGTYKIGAWYDTADFPDRQFDMFGLSLANPLSNGIARNDRGNFSVYGVADQMLWREAGGPRSIGVFVRAMAAPSDRNLIDFSLNAGLNVKAPFPGREHDTFG
ncbi:MAG: carbohydrate porin, partial [Bradyrhizobium sp.]